MTKTYTLLTIMQTTLVVEIDEKPVECMFRGGKYYPYRENGSFRTSDVKVQDALEQHEWFNKQFVLVKTTNIEPEVEVPAKPVTPKPTIEPEPPVEDENPDLTEQEPETTEQPKVTSDGAIVVDEVKNGQTAKLYLNKNFSVPFSRLNTTEKIMAEAKLANLTFPNWKING